MAKVPVPVEDILNNPRVSISSSPFAPGKMIIKKASFPGGEVPEHLKAFKIKEELCKDITGTVTYKGKKIPAAAVCVAAVHHPEILVKYPELAEKLDEKGRLKKFHETHEEYEKARPKVKVDRKERMKRLIEKAELIAKYIETGDKQVLEELKKLKQEKQQQEQSTS